MPNIVVPRNAVTKQVIGHSFKAFVPGDQPSITALVKSNRSGNSQVVSPDQIACAQESVGMEYAHFQYTANPHRMLINRSVNSMGWKEMPVQNASGESARLQVIWMVMDWMNCWSLSHTADHPGQNLMFLISLLMERFSDESLFRHFRISI